MTDVNTLAKEIHKTAVEKGWWEDKDRNFGESIALMHSELSEALEAWREGRSYAWFDEDGKPQGWGFELIDCIIRIFDFLEQRSFNIEWMLKEKMAYNKTRSYRHGGKKA